MIILRINLVCITFHAFDFSTSRDFIWHNVHLKRFSKMAMQRRNWTKKKKQKKDLFKIREMRRDEGWSSYIPQLKMKQETGAQSRFLILLGFLLLPALNGNGWWVFPYLFPSNKRKKHIQHYQPPTFISSFVERGPERPVVLNETSQLELLTTIIPTI